MEPLHHLIASDTRVDDPTESLVRLTAELHQMRAELDATIRLASHDALTGLPNRRTITDRLAQAIDHANDDVAVAAMFVDVDRFKIINDLYFYEVGDRLLREFADRLRDSLG